MTDPSRRCESLRDWRVFSVNTSCVTSFRLLSVLCSTSSVLVNVLYPSHFPSASLSLIWLLQVGSVTSPRSTWPPPADSTGAFRTCSSLRVRWEQTLQAAGWPHCVTFTPTHTKFVLNGVPQACMSCLEKKRNELIEAGQPGTSHDCDSGVSGLINSCPFCNELTD